MSASASGEGERAGDWSGEGGMLPLPVDRVGVLVPAFGAFDGAGTAAGVVGDGAEERINVSFDGLVASLVARGEGFGRTFAPVDGISTGLVVAV